MRDELEGDMGAYKVANSYLKRAKTVCGKGDIVADSMVFPFLHFI